VQLLVFMRRMSDVVNKFLWVWSTEVHRAQPAYYVFEPYAPRYWRAVRKSRLLRTNLLIT
jgi:hypothetical protein